jgi:hypothetical protein
MFMPNRLFGFLCRLDAGLADITCEHLDRDRTAMQSFTKRLVQ